MRDRRATVTRQALVRQVMEEIFSRRWFTLASIDCSNVFGVSPEICVRILGELERAGVVRQAAPGTWTRTYS